MLDVTPSLPTEPRLQRQLQDTVRQAGNVFLNTVRPLQTTNDTHDSDRQLRAVRASSRLRWAVAVHHSAGMTDRREVARRSTRVPVLRISAICLALVSTACSSGGVDSSGLTEFQSARRIMELPLSEFVDEADATSHDSRLNWTTDRCSGPSVISIWDDEFGDACRRHDFGYRNFGSSKALDRTADRRDLIDETFASDMAAVCETRDGPLQASCRLDANVFYLAVHATPWGRSAFFDGT